jgi:hypothetical protein
MRTAELQSACQGGRADVHHVRAGRQDKAMESPLYMRHSASQFAVCITRLSVHCNVFTNLLRASSPFSEFAAGCLGRVKLTCRSHLGKHLAKLLCVRAQCFVVDRASAKSHACGQTEAIPRCPPRPSLRPPVCGRSRLSDRSAQSGHHAAPTNLQGLQLIARGSAEPDRPYRDFSVSTHERDDGNRRGSWFTVAIVSPL